jgi:hypothetical protein
MWYCFCNSTQNYTKLNQEFTQTQKSNRVKKELTLARKRVTDQLELTLTHKERMKDKEVERERIRYLNLQERVNNRYSKAHSANEKKHIRKTTTNRERMLVQLWQGRLKLQ